MKVEFLKSLGLDDEVIAKIQVESGKDVQAEKDKTKKAQDDLAAANGKIAEFEKQDPAGLAQKVSDLQKIIDERKKADDEAIRDKNIGERFDKVTGERKYLNDFTKNGILAEFKAALDDKANAGKSDSELFEALVKDRDGVFESKNVAANIPGSGKTNFGQADQNAVRAVMGLPPLK
ncbi:MAG: hypothetical protein ACI4RV_06435 [Eubacteriales bacterium]